MTSWYMVKHTADLFRGEPINVGVLVVSDQGVACKFLGQLESGKIDGRVIPRSLGGAETYRAWVAFWTKEARQHRLDERIERLAGRGDNYTCTRVGSILQEASGVDPARLAEELFERYVAPVKTVEPSIDDYARAAVGQLHLPPRHVLEPDFSLNIKVRGESTSLHFGYGHLRESTPVSLVEKLSLKDTARARDARVDSILFRIGEAESSTNISNFVVLYLPGGEKWEDDVRLIERYAKTIDITNSVAAGADLYDALVA